MALISSDLLFEMAGLISSGGKPCFYRDLYIRNGEKCLSDMKSSLIFAKKMNPCIRIYISKIDIHNDPSLSGYHFFMYRFDFQKEIFKLRFTNKTITNRKLFDWSLAGLLFGYSPREIQEKYDDNRKLQNGTR